MIFDEAIATTFSLDPAVLLEAPVYLAMLPKDGDSAFDPLLVLDSVRRYSKKITVFVQNGRIQVSQQTNPNPLYTYLEDMVIEVTAPNGGVFHPKIWGIRFISPESDEKVYRLAILSRNITNDRSWDLALQLEGQSIDDNLSLNDPLVKLIGELPNLAARDIKKDRQEQAINFAKELNQVDWKIPTDYKEIVFFVPDSDEFDCFPAQADNLAIISPFCSDYTISQLSKRSNKATALISRPDTLASLDAASLSFFTNCYCLDDAAESEESEDLDAKKHQDVNGLHAKVYVFETKYHTDYTHLILGSANATNAALSNSNNVEFLVRLTGKKRKVGGIEDLLGSDGLGNYLNEFTPPETKED